MFNSANFYIIVSNCSFIIRKEDEDFENVIELQSFIPNVPAYYHLHDIDKKDYINDIKSQIKRLKIKSAIIILPDDSIELEVDKRMLIEFLLQIGVKKVQVNYQCFFIGFDNKKYITVSKTSRTIVLQYIEYNSTIYKKYYDKNYTDIEQIIIDMKKFHNDNIYGAIPVFINNINNDMEGFMNIGNLVYIHDLVTNILNKKNNI